MSSLQRHFLRRVVQGVGRERKSRWGLITERKMANVVNDGGDSTEEIVNGAVGGGGGVEDVYGEDFATEEQFLTPWAVSIASGYNLMRDPRHNKGTAFTEKERDAHYLRGLLPPAIFTQELQEKRLMHNLRQFEVPLQRYMAMMDLQERNERLFYKLLIDNVEELLPVVYTPTVGEACQKYGSIFRRPQGLYISLKEKGKILEVLKNWPERNIQVIVVTDGERILGLGDLGCQGMGIPVGKLSLYTALGGIRPSACLPITIDVGTNNEKLLNDEFYIGLKQRRATGQEYAELLEEFMTAVKQNYGEKVLVQFEDFANHNAFDLLEKYTRSHLVFNDDIQANNAYIFPGFGLGLIMSGAIRVHDDLLLAASEALAVQVEDEHFKKGLIYPPFTNIRKISANIAAKVADKAYQLGLASRLPRPKDLVKHAESCMYSPLYRTYR
ncbi:unnamed protein product [Linum tenue]|uniref:Malic enzyme n=1 Tax=Linum tenue TaxID=586396 RepID=A0AAV0JJT0_9ROSI|nr:unnamed protein product [Linum tenue]